MSDIMNLNDLEIDVVSGASGGMGFWQSVGWAYDNPGEAVGWAMDQMGTSEKGYYANGVYNIK